MASTGRGRGRGRGLLAPKVGSSPRPGPDGESETNNVSKQQTVALCIYRPNFLYMSCSSCPIKFRTALACNLSYKVL